MANRLSVEIELRLSKAVVFRQKKKKKKCSDLEVRNSTLPDLSPTHCTADPRHISPNP